MPLRLACMLIMLTLLAACGVKPVPTRDGTISPWMGTLAEMHEFPQDLTVYAKDYGEDRLLVDPAEQALQDANFNRRLFTPWDMAKTSVRQRDIAGIFKKARGWRMGDVKWTQAEWDAIARNANIRAFPSRAQAAISVRNTDLREMPTHQCRFSEPTPDPRANPFDYFQYSLLPVGTPVLIAHTSLDGRWHFVECPVASGWVDANDLALVDAQFASIWRNSPLAAIMRDGVGLAPAGRQAGITANIGTVLPIAANSGSALSLLVPVRDAQGMAQALTASVSPDLAQPKPVPMTAGAVARVGNDMMGQRYGWGGMFGERDCSALTRELMTPFGIWLPRNSGAQARVGTIVPLSGMDVEGKKAAILAQGTPFLSLVALRGHVTLYVGRHKGKPAIFHNTWGVRTVQGGNTNSRFIIGRAVVTSITPGNELKNLYRESTFADRLHTLATPAASNR